MDASPDSDGTQRDGSNPFPTRSILVGLALLSVALNLELFAPLGFAGWRQAGNAEFVMVHPFTVLNLSMAEPVVDLSGLAAKSVAPLILVFGAALVMLRPLASWLEDGDGLGRVVRDLYKSGQESHPILKTERERRESLVTEWGQGYGRAARALLYIEIGIAAVLIPTAMLKSPGTGEDAVLVPALVGTAYVIRFLAWFALWGFVLWVYIRPLVVDCVIDPALPSSEDRSAPQRPTGTALAFSGGGIRSAAFTAGAIDALQTDQDEWRKVRYVCAVSGGAYTAGALAGLRASALEDNGENRADLATDWADNAFRLGNPALDHIRNNSMYLAPGISGKVRAFNEWGSGVLVTIIMYTASVFAVGAVLGIVAACLQDDPRVLDVSSVGAGWSVLATGLIGVGSTIASHQASDEDTTKSLLRCGEIFGWMWAFLAFIVFVVPSFFSLVRWLRDGIPPIVAWIGGLVASGTLTFATVRSIVKQASAPIATFLAGIIVPVLTVAGLAYSAFRGVELNPIYQNPDYSLGQNLVVVVAVVSCLGIALMLDATEMSLFPFYRRRLTSAFSLGRAGNEVRVRSGKNRLPLGRIESPDPSKGRATVICGAANVMGSPITPPGRGALSFTFSGDGGNISGVRGARLAPSRLEPRKAKTFPLMSAVAISGAAVSPGMGKMTKRSYESLMAVLNVRLGVWMPNPVDPVHSKKPSRQSGVKDTWLALIRDKGIFGLRRRITHPRMLPYFYKELLGLHNILDPYLYVTDGGHWDNLGLVEALRLHPAKIIVFDSSGDSPGTFATLGEAKSLAEMELGVRIDLDPSSLTKGGETGRKRFLLFRARTDSASSRPPRCFVTGKAKYPQGGECSLTFCRALVTDDAPVNIASFQAKHQSFPNHSTLRQLFDDETFEAYRALGYHCAKSIAAPDAGWIPVLYRGVPGWIKSGSGQPKG